MSFRMRRQTWKMRQFMINKSEFLGQRKKEKSCTVETLPLSAVWSIVFLVWMEMDIMEYLVAEHDISVLWCAYRYTHYSSSKNLIENLVWVKCSHTM